jgi:hypothetical protein
LQAFLLDQTAQNHRFLGLLIQHLDSGHLLFRGGNRFLNEGTVLTLDHLGGRIPDDICEDFDHLSDGPLVLPERSIQFTWDEE